MFYTIANMTWIPQGHTNKELIRKANSYIYLTCMTWLINEFIYLKHEINNYKNNYEIFWIKLNV